MDPTVRLVILGIVVLIAIGVVWYVVTRFLVNIGAKEVGIKERRYFGRRMPQGRVVATDGEVGLQADVLKPGLHFVMYPVERVVQKVPLVEIGADELGVIEAIDGEPMPMGSIFAPDRAQNAHNNFQDPIAFIKQGGVKGIQLRMLPPGKWAIHPYLFRVSIAQTTVVPPGRSVLLPPPMAPRSTRAGCMVRRSRTIRTFRTPRLLSTTAAKKARRSRY